MEKTGTDFSLLQHQTEQNGVIYGEGSRNFAGRIRFFFRALITIFHPVPIDIYVSRSPIHD